MNLRLLTGLAILLAAGTSVAQDTPAPKTTAPKGAAPAKAGELKTLKDKASYSIGLNIGNDLRGQELEVEAAALIQGLKDGLSDPEKTKPQLTEKEIMEVMQAYQKDMMSKKEARDKVAGEKNKKDGEAFLAANKKKEGVKTLPVDSSTRLSKKAPARRLGPRTS